MARANVMEIAPEIKYDEIETLIDLRGALSQFKRLHPDEALSNDNKLADICRVWFGKMGALDDFKPNDPIEDLIEIVDQVIKAEREASQLHEEEKTNEFESKALDSQRLEILLEEFDKKQDLRAEDLSKHPAFLGVKISEIQKIIERKIALQTEAIKRGESVKLADLDSDLQLVTEAKLIETGVEAEKAEKIAISAVEIAMKSETLSDTREKIEKVLKEEKIEGDLKQEIEKSTVNKTAEVIVVVQEERIVDNFIEKLKTEYQITPEKEKEVRAEVYKRLDLEIRESLPKVNEKQIIRTENTSKAESLTDRVAMIVNEGGDRDKIGLIAKEVEKEADRLIANKPEVVGIYRKEVAENQIKESLILKGFEVKTAFEEAHYWGEFIYPKKHEAEMVVVDEKAIQTGQEKGFSGENLKLASKRAQVITRLVNSDKPVEENVVEMLRHSEGINNEYTDTAKQLSKDRGAIRSLEYIRKTINFQKRFDTIRGNGAIQMGRLINSEKLQLWGQNLLNKIGTSTKLADFSGAATTWFGWAQNNQLSLGWALNKISDAWLGAGLKPIQFGGILGKIGGNNLLGLGKNVFSSSQVLAKKAGMNALGALKGLATKFAPKLAAGLGKLALGAVAWPLAVLSMFDLKEIFKLIMYVVGGLFVGLLVIIPLLTLGPISSIVPTTGAGLGQEKIDENSVVGHVDEHGNPIIVTGQAAPGLPVDFLPGATCDASRFTVSGIYKQCGSDWSGQVLPGDPSGTVCSSGCGPTSASMAVATINGNCKPDKMYTDTICGGDIYGTSGKSGTYVQQNADVLKRFFPNTRITSCGSAKEIANLVCGDGGTLVMVLADFYYNATSTGGHYFLATGVKDGQLVVKDPYFPKANPFDGKAEFGSVYKVIQCILIKK